MNLDQLALDAAAPFCPNRGEQASDRLGVYEQRCVKVPDHDGPCLLVWYVVHTAIEDVRVAGGVL